MMQIKHHFTEQVVFFSDSEPEIFTSAALTYPKLYSLIPPYILKVFTGGFDHI